MRQYTKYPKPILAAVESLDTLKGNELYSAIQNTSNVRLLRRLFEEFKRDPYAQDAFCKNPNTPLDIAQQIINNSEDPWARSNRIYALARWSKNPELLTQIFHEYPQQIDSLSYNSNLPDSIAKQMLDHTNPGIVGRALSHFPASEIDVSSLNSSSAAALADHTNDPETLKLLSNLNDYRVVKKIANNDNTPESVLQKLKQKYGVIDGTGLESARLTKDQFRNILSAGSGNMEIVSLAHNPQFPTELYSTVAHDPNNKIRILLAKMSNIPEDTLAIFSKDNDVDVRVIVAQRKDIPLNLINQLSKDKSAKVRLAIATNPQTPKSVLSTMVNDPSKTVQQAVRTNTSFIDESYVDEIVQNGSEIAFNKLITSKLPLPYLLKACTARMKQISNKATPIVLKNILDAFANNPSLIDRLR